MSRPVIFISAVSRELKTTRDLVAKTLTALGYEPKWQDIAPTETGDLKAVLRKWVDSSQAVLQIVGHRHGFAPEDPDPEFGHVSYTQYEALYARKKGKPVWYIILDESHPTDLPNDEPQELQKLQSDYRIQVKAHHGLFHPSTDPLSTENIVLRLRDDLSKLRRRSKQWAAILIALFLITISGITWIILRQEKTDQAVATTKTATQETAGKVDTVLTRYRQMEKALIALADAESRSRNPGEELTQEQLRASAYTLLETELGLTPGTLAASLPGFALELYSSPDTDLLMKARAAYALNKFEEAEKLFLQSEAKDKAAMENAEKVANDLRTKRIEALEGAAQSTTAQIQYARAIEHYREAATLTSLERDPLEWARVHHNLASVLFDHGQFAEAANTLRQTIPVYEKHLGAEHPDTLSSRNNLANALQYQGKHAEAEQEQRTVLAIYQRVLGAKHPYTLGSRNNLAEALRVQGKYAEAEQEHRAVLAIRQRVFGAEHRDTLASHGNLANVLLAQGKYAEAEQENRTALAIYQRVLGAEHPHTLGSRSNLAVTLQHQGKHAEAEPEHRAVLIIYQRVLGAEHPHTLGSHNNLAIALQAQGKYAEAEQENRTALAIYQRVLGAEHPDTLDSRSNLANTLRAQGKHAEAEQEHRAILAILQRVLGAEHPDVYYSCYSLSLCLMDQEKIPEALVFAKRSLAGRTETLGKDHPYTKLAQEHVTMLESLPPPPGDDSGE